MDKAESYIILKPIAERFNRVASEITDDEIKSLIKEELREQVSTLNFSREISSMFGEWVEDNEDVIKSLFLNSIKEKLK